MELKSNKGFSLLEIIITTAILSTAVVFVFRAFSTVLSAASYSRDITYSCLLAETKLGNIREDISKGVNPLELSGTEKIDGKTFSWNCSLYPNFSGIANLIRVEFYVDWPRGGRIGQGKFLINTCVLSK